MTRTRRVSPQRFGPELTAQRADRPFEHLRGRRATSPLARRGVGAPYGWLDVGDGIRPRENICVYAVTFIRAKPNTRVSRNISLWVGAAGAFRVFWNADKILEDSGYRELDVDRFAVPVVLDPSGDRITIKVCSTADSLKFALRIGDEQGAPDLGIEAQARSRPCPAVPRSGAPGHQAAGDANCSGAHAGIRARNHWKPVRCRVSLRHLHATWCSRAETSSLNIAHAISQPELLRPNPPWLICTGRTALRRSEHRT